MTLLLLLGEMRQKGEKGIIAKNTGGGEKKGDDQESTKVDATQTKERGSEADRGTGQVLARTGTGGSVKKRGRRRDWGESRGDSAQC